MTYIEPLHEISHLSMVEMYSTDFNASLKFFTEILGMQLTEREGNVAWLRGYEDRYHHSLKLVGADHAGIGAICWRTMSPQALERRVAAIEASERPGKWVEAEKGYGRSYEFTTPDGHRNRLFWDVDYFVPSEEQRSRLLSRVQKRPNMGVPVRRLDHVNLLCTDPSTHSDFLQRTLGFRKTENVVVGGDELACWLTVNPLVHEVAFTKDQFGPGNRLHHVAFWYGNPGQMLDVADLLKEHDIRIEAGPGKHGVSQAYFLYLYEPGGNRIELFGDNGYMIFDPEWKTLTWNMENFMKDGAIWFGGDLPQDFFVYGTPLVQAAADEQAPALENTPAE